MRGKPIAMRSLRDCRVFKANEQRQPYWQAWQTVLIVSAPNAKRPIENMSFSSAPSGALYVMMCHHRSEQLFHSFHLSQCDSVTNNSRNNGATV